MKKRSQTDWNRLDSMTDETIDTSDVPPLDEDFFSRATIRLPKKKAAITLRVDSEVLEWFRSKGRGYQTLMNAVLKAYVKAHK